MKLRALTGVMVRFVYGRVPKCGSKQHSSCTHQTTVCIRALTGVMVRFVYGRVPKCGSKQHSSCTHQTTVCIRVTASAGLTASYQQFLLLLHRFPLGTQSSNNFDRAIMAATQHVAGLNLGSETRLS